MQRYLILISSKFRYNYTKNKSYTKFGLINITLVLRLSITTNDITLGSIYASGEKKITIYKKN